MYRHEDNLFFKGFGECIAWEGNSLGQDLLNNNIHGEYFYSLLYNNKKSYPIYYKYKNNTITNKKIPSLRLNIARFYAGGSTRSTITYNGQILQEQYPPDAGRRQFGFWNYWTDNDTNWDWKADEGQVAILKKAKELGAQYFELSSNSPLWFFTKSKSVQGVNKALKVYLLDSCPNDPELCNLQYWNIGDHAFYLTKVALYAKTEWGINFYSIAPYNEPTGFATSFEYCSGWSSITSSNQEGCMYDMNTRKQLIQSLHTLIKNNTEHSHPILLSVDDENQYFYAIKSMEYYKDNNVYDIIDKINVHGYIYGKNDASNTDMIDLRNKNIYKEIWQSEISSEHVEFYFWSTQIMMTLIDLKPQAYILWTLFDSSPWGWTSGDNFDNSTNNNNIYYYVPDKYWAVLHFSRFLLPGMNIRVAKTCGTVIDKYTGKNIDICDYYGSERYNKTNYYLQSDNNEGVISVIYINISDHDSSYTIPFTSFSDGKIYAIKTSFNETDIIGTPYEPINNNIILSNTLQCPPMTIISVMFVPNHLDQNTYIPF